MARAPVTARGFWDRLVRRIAVSALRERIGGVLTHVASRRERVVLTRHGHEIGALVPMEDLEALRALDRKPESRTLRAYRASWRRITGPGERGH